MSALLLRLRAAAELPELARRRMARVDGFSRDDLDRLLELARRLNECREPEEALAALLRAAIRLTDADRAVLVERDGDGHRVALGIDRDGAPLDRPDERISHSIVERVLARGEALKSENLSEDLDLSRARSVVDLDLKSSLCVPLRRLGAVTGAIYVDSNSTTRFREPMLALLEGTCELASMTLAELQLRRDERRRREAFERLEASHASLVDALPGALVVHDDEGLVQFGNAWWERHLKGAGLFPGCAEAPAGARLAPELRQALAEALAAGRGSLDRGCAGLELRFWPYRLPARGDGPELRAAIVADVSLEKALQRDVLEKEKLSLAAQMAGSVAHEIRNALAPLAGHAEVLGLKLGACEAARGAWEDDLTVIEEMAARVGRIAANLGRLSKPLTSAPEPTDLNALLERTVTLLRETGGKIKGFRVLEDGEEAAPGQACSLRLELAPGLPTPTLDPDLFQQLLMNLIINAAHAVEEKGGGRIELRTGLADGRLTLEVADTGVGMGPETLARIWEPYYSTKGERGTGLGMSLVRMVAEAHRATLHVESVAGEGTRFRLELPLA